MSTSYKDLVVWQKSMDLTEMIYGLVKYLPREEMYALSDQLRRAVVSIPSNIAEGHGRNSPKEFIKFLTISRGSLYEVETQLEIANRLKLIPSDSSVEAQLLIIEISKMINSLIGYLGYSCQLTSSTKN